MEETAHITLTHTDGAVGTVEVSRCDDYADAFDLICERGRITVTGAHARIHVAEPGGLVHTVESDANDDPLARMLAHHATTLGDEEIDRVETNIALDATALMAAAYASLASESPEPLPSFNTSLQRTAS